MLNKNKIKTEIYAYLLLIIGSLLFAVGDVMFVNPYLLAPGGTYGLALEDQLLCHLHGYSLADYRYFGFGSTLWGENSGVNGVDFPVHLFDRNPVGI